MTIEVDEFREICNLPDEELEARRTRVSQELFAFVRKREERPEGLALYFDETPEMREQLNQFVAAERVCCSSLDWSVHNDSGALRLEINGIDPRSAAFASVGSGSGLPEELEPEGSGIWPRLFRSIGLGSFGAIFVCCVLPLGIAAVVGTTPLLFLDNPWLIAGSAVGLGGFLWHWEGRRKANSAAGCGC